MKGVSNRNREASRRRRENPGWTVAAEKRGRSAVTQAALGWRLTINPAASRPACPRRIARSFLAKAKEECPQPDRKVQTSVVGDANLAF
jgi:hypothetical protein